MSMEESVAVAALSVAVVETFRTYREVAPPLSDIRNGQGSPIGIFDADVMGIIVVLAIGGGGAFLTGRIYPLLLSGVALALISGYYHYVESNAMEAV